MSLASQITLLATRIGQEIKAVRAEIASLGGTPAGIVSSTASATAPIGWLLLDGSTIASGQTLYPALWSVIPTSWKSGSSILLPDGRGRTVIGAGTGSGLTARTLGVANIGEENHSLTTAELASHTHTGLTGNNNQDHSHTTGSANTGTGGAGSGTMRPGTPGIATSGISSAHTHNFTTDASGSGTGHNNMQPSFVLNWIIKT